MLQGFEDIIIDTWLSVIPQIMARIHTPNKKVRRMIQDLLCKIGKAHPQVLYILVLIPNQPISKKTDSRLGFGLPVNRSFPVPLAGNSFNGDKNETIFF